MDESPSWHDEYPFKSHYLEADGYRYHFLDEGEGDPVLMVHGNPTWSFYWRHLVLALSPRHRAIAVDHLGCGLSDKPLDYPYRLEDHVANLAGLVHALDLKNITLVVHDWGGPIGLSAALQLQERIGRLVSSPQNELS